MASHLFTILEELATAGTTKPVRAGRSPYSNEPGSGNVLFDAGAQVILEIDRVPPVVGALTVYGMDAGDPQGSPVQLNSGVPTAQNFKGDGVTTQFQTIIPFIVLANNNWIVTSGRFLTSSTATVTAGSKVVTGAATSFLTEYSVGQSILINGETKIVEFVASNTVLTTTIAFAASAAGVVIASVGSPLPAAGIAAITNVGGFARVDLAVAPLVNVPLAVYFGVPVQVYPSAVASTGLDRIKKQQIRCYEFMWTLLGATPTATSVHLRPASGK